MKAAIVGLSGPALTANEAAMLGADPPAGVILFSRNIRDPDQVRRLIGSVRAIVPDALLMVDQEGGRVARLRPPHWRAHPPAGVLGRLFDANADAALRAAYLTGALIGAECASLGFDIVAAPVLDRAVAGAENGIGDRAFAADPHVVSRMGGALASGLLAAGIQPVMKHVPGHGRAGADSHHALPVVDASGVDSGEADADILPFSLNATLPWAMTAHILYPDWDTELPATLSRRIVEGVIRGRIGFGGVLVSDDLAMGALSGAPADRALGALAAGCDLALYCAGDLGATRAVLAACPEPGREGAERLASARAIAARARRPIDPTAFADERDRLVG